MGANNNRRENHSGSYRQRDNGSWEARIKIDGISKSFYGKTRAEVQKQISAYRVKCDKGFFEPKKVRLNEVAEIFLYQYKIKRVKPNSFDSLESIWKCHIKDSQIGDMYVGNIRTSYIQDILDEKRLSKEKPLALSGIKRIYDFLSQLFNYVVSQEILYENDNPMRNIHLPKEEDMLVSTKETFCLTPDELEALKNVCMQKNSNGTYKYKYGLLFLLLANIGLRIGELLALDISDIDIEKRYIKINKALVSGIINRSGKGNKRQFVIGSTKTKKANRLVKLNDNAIYYIKEIIHDNELRGIKQPYLCCARNGSRAAARNLQRTLDQLSDVANIRHVTLHIFRHTYGSTLLRNGVNIATISHMLGHANVNITYNHYIHVIEEQEIEAVQYNNVI